MTLGSMAIKWGTKKCFLDSHVNNWAHTVIQLQTTKANKLNISGTRFFDKNLRTDLKLDRLKELKNGVFMLFPCVFGCTKILSKFFSQYQVYRWLNLKT
jgi:hypothetical protein